MAVWQSLSLPVQAPLLRFLGEQHDDDDAQAGRTDGPRATAASWAASEGGGEGEGDGDGFDGAVPDSAPLGGPAARAASPRAAATAATHGGDLAWDSSTPPHGMLSQGLQQRFESATNTARELPAEGISSADRLRLYAWFKQTAAPATSAAQPSRLAVTARAKWDAWHAARSLSPEAAALAYCELVSSLCAAGPAARAISPRATAATTAPSAPRAAAQSFRPLAELRMLADLEEQAGQISALRTSVHQTHLAASLLVAAAALGTAAALAAPHMSSSLALPHVPLWAWAATAVAALLGALGYAWLALRRQLELKLLTRAVRITWLFASVLGRYKLARVRSRRLEAKVTLTLFLTVTTDY